MSEPRPLSVPLRWAILNLRFKRSGWWHTNLQGVWLVTRTEIVRRRKRTRVHG